MSPFMIKAQLRRVSLPPQPHLNSDRNGPEGADQIMSKPRDPRVHDLRIGEMKLDLFEIWP